MSSNERPNTVAAIETKDGTVYYGRNSGGVVNKDVEKSLDKVGRNAFNGQCAEINAIATAKNAEANLEGAEISIANVRGFNSVGGLHGTFKAPCDTCSSVIKLFGITVIGGD